MPVVDSGVGQDYLEPGSALVPGVTTTSNIPAEGFPVDRVHACQSWGPREGVWLLAGSSC